MSELALFGGPPVRTESFPVWPRPTSDLRDSLIKTLDSEGWGVGSEAIERFESAFADFQDAKYCISTSSGTTALWVALKAAGVKAGTLNLDPEKVAASITDKTKAIMPVHIAGGPADMDAILEIGKTHGIPIIEDAAQAHGAEWNGTKVGAIGLGGIFSFQTSKNMTAGEGGAIISNDDDFMDACFSYHNCGRVKGGEWYEHSHLGGNFRLNAMAASMLFPQIESLQQDMEIRDKNALMLDEAVHSINGIDRVKQENGTTRHAHHLYITKYDASAFNGIAREAFFKAMQAEGVYTYAGYTPLYREKLFITNADEYPWLKDRDYGSLSMPNTELIADEQAVWLKQNHLLGSEEDTKDIINAFEKVTDAMNKEPDLFLK